MAEYIEREALKNNLHCTKQGLFFCGGKTYIDFDVVSKAVLETPGADVVEVVRCKDCKHAIINERHENKPLICCFTKMCGTTHPDWYCADGTKMDGKGDGE